jgi:hypothetical protein
MEINLKQSIIKILGPRGFKNCIVLFLVMTSFSPVEGPCFLQLHLLSSALNMEGTCTSGTADRNTKRAVYHFTWQYIYSSIYPFFQPRIHARTHQPIQPTGLQVEGLVRFSIVVLRLQYPLRLLIIA